MKTAFRKLTAPASVSLFRNFGFLLLFLLLIGATLYVLINSPA